ncbi:MAG: hypothetical protein OHK0046_01890 [Anaerolineae bacterium]
MRRYLIFLALLLIGLAACEPAAPPPQTAVIITATPRPLNTPLNPPPTVAIPALTLTVALSPTLETSGNGQVVVNEAGINLFTAPSGSAPVIRIIRSSAPLTLIGRTAENDWLQARFADGVIGWLLRATVQTDLDIAQLAVTGETDGVPVLAATPTLPADARVQLNAGGLRLRTLPNTDSDVLENLDPETPLSVYGRTEDSNWLRVQEPGGTIGWVAAGFLDININLNQVAIVRDFATAVPVVEGGQGSVVGVVSGITERAREVFDSGQAQGNRANVFSKIGDSQTIAPHAFTPLGQDVVNLDRYGYLQATIDYFTAENARDGNAFTNVSLAASTGWTTEDVLNPGNANTGACQPGDSPLVCEYRLVRPAVALIMLGTNDVAGLPLEVYRANLQGIMQTSVDMGVIPVLSTIPQRPGFNVDPFNEVIVSVASEFQMPLWDYASAMRTAPGNGLSDDGVHPSAPPGDPATAADFSQLQYGYTLRNLTALQVLDALRQSVLTRN